MQRSASERCLQASNAASLTLHVHLHKCSSMHHVAVGKHASVYSSMDGRYMQLTPFIHPIHTCSISLFTRICAMSPFRAHELRLCSQTT